MGKEVTMRGLLRKEERLSRKLRKIRNKIYKLLEDGDFWDGSPGTGHP